MKIIEKSNGLTDRKLFKMTQGKGLTKVSDCDGRQFDIVDYVIYTDSNSRTGEEQELLAFSTETGEILSTNSATVIRSFRAMIEAFETLPITGVCVLSGQSKNGRTYYDIDLVD